MRQIVLDTETTGLEPELGHRIIEIGALELVNRRATGRTFHRYLNPERDIDEGALAVHGITRAQLAQEPTFGRIAAELLDFLSGAELVIHNAAFDVAFLDAELATWRRSVGGEGDPRHIKDCCRVLDTLALARSLHPGQRNSLDALCKRYGVDNSRRELHGALLDARILADVYLAMTGGQGALALEEARDESGAGAKTAGVRVLVPSGALKVIRASDAELAAHAAMLAAIDRESGGRCLWRQLDVGVACPEARTA
jgi:DNA polymerase-3 subunit epsilon